MVNTLPPKPSVTEPKPEEPKPAFTLFQCNVEKGAKGFGFSLKQVAPAGGNLILF